MDVDFTVQSQIDRTPRVVQLEGAFDCPLTEKLTQSWKGTVPIEEKPEGANSECDGNA